MTWFDYTVIVIAIWSILLGWWRGFVYEVLSLFGWVVAYAVARWQAANLAALMPAELGMDAVKLTVAFVLLFVATLIVSGFVVWLISKLVKSTGLGLIDGLLGSLFGILRGTLIVLMLVLLAGLTDLPQKPFWREAKLSKPLESLALSSLVWLPDSVARHVHFGLRK